MKYDDDDGTAAPLGPDDLAAVWGDDPYDPAGYQLGDDGEADPPGSVHMERLRFAASDGDELADWHARKVLAIKQRAEADDARFATAIKRLQSQRRRVREQHNHASQWHLAALHQWHRAAHPGSKSIKLPSGTYWTRSGSYDVPTPEGDAADLLRAELGDHEPEVFEAQPDKFRVQRLRALVAPVDVGEPGSRVELVFRETGERLEGITGVARRGQHGVKP